MKNNALIALSLAALTVGCGGMSKAEDATGAAHYRDAVTAAPQGGGDFLEIGGLAGEMDDRGEMSKSVGIAPKLIRTGDISVTVDVFEPFRADLAAWLSDAGGYVADASLNHTEGEVSWASLTVRVPVASFDALVGWTEEQVQVQSLNLRSADVTAEWVDVEARIENSQREETRLQELLETETGTLADVLAVERELARVRGDIESAEGRMRVLRDQVGFSTLQVYVQVNQVYEPYVAANFGGQIVGTFQSSISAMAAFGRGAVLTGVAVAPWLLLPGLGFGWLVVTARRRRQVS